jgi:predicted  nucleic acid-binding Zn-ribbon protein
MDYELERATRPRDPIRERRRERVRRQMSEAKMMQKAQAAVAQQAQALPTPSPSVESLWKDFSEAMRGVGLLVKTVARLDRRLKRLEAKQHDSERKLEQLETKQREPDNTVSTAVEKVMSGFDRLTAKIDKLEQARKPATVSAIDIFEHARGLN